MIFLERSIDHSTQSTVFEPNDQRPRTTFRQTVAVFLTAKCRSGALPGAREGDAFSVTVARETMIQDDMLNGGRIIGVGIAPVRPAEFVIFPVSQKTREADN